MNTLLSYQVKPSGKVFYNCDSSSGSTVIFVIFASIVPPSSWRMFSFKTLAESIVGNRGWGVLKWYSCTRDYKTLGRSEHVSSKQAYSLLMWESTHPETWCWIRGHICQSICNSLKVRGIEFHLYVMTLVITHWTTYPWLSPWNLLGWKITIFQ